MTRIVDYPTCGDWLCDDGEHWAITGPGTPEWPGVRREEQILLYHQPRGQWRERLAQERADRNGGRPLWELSPCP